MKELVSIFLRIGVLGFGGPLATMGMMQEEVCAKRKWMSDAEFAQVYALCKLLPGPVATQMAIYLGNQRAGAWGGILSGSLFVLPSFVAVLALSALYVSLGTRMAGLQPIFTGLQAGAMAVILLSTVALARPYSGRRSAWGVAALSAAGIFAFPRYEPLVILAAGLFGVVFSRAVTRSRSEPGRSMHAVGWLSAAWAAGPALAAGGTAVPAGLVFRQLFWVCFKAGAFVFGSGLAIVPLLEADAVSQFHWLTHHEFMDGLAIGQVTPGPVVITATFIGYKAAGFWGAVVATFAMFLPAFFNVLVLVPRTWAKMRGTSGAEAFSAWAIPAVIGGILATSGRLAFITLNTPMAIAIFGASLIWAVWKRPAPWILIPAAGLVAWGATSLGLR